MEKVAKAKMRPKKAAANVVSSGEGCKSSEYAEKQIIGAKMVPEIVLCDWEVEDEERVSGEVWIEQGNWEEEHTVIYNGDMLDLVNAIEHGKWRAGVRSQPPVVTM
jgi:hypothetical protein